MGFLSPRLRKRFDSLSKQGYDVSDISRAGQLRDMGKQLEWHARSEKEQGRRAQAAHYRKLAQLKRRELQRALSSRNLKKVPSFATEHERMQHLASQQNPHTGAWAGPDAPYWAQIANTVDVLEQLNKAGIRPKHPLKFLNPISTPQGLEKYLRGLLYSYNIANRKELNVGVTSLPIFYHDAQAYHHFAPGWRETFLSFFKEWQNPATGCWGTWIKKEGKVVKLDDLSMTFHNISRIKNLGGRVAYPRKIIDTIWRMRNNEYPYGWLENGKLSSHHAWDVARIFTTFYPAMNRSEQQRTRELFNHFLDFALKECISESGAMREFGGTAEAPSIVGTAWGVHLLEHIGYFKRAARETVFGRTPLPVNSYRVYKGKPPHSEFDTSILVGVLHTQTTTIPDPLVTRNKIAEYVAQTREHDPISRGMIVQTLHLTDHPARPVQSLTPTELETFRREGYTVVGIDTFGGVVQQPTRVRQALHRLQNAFRRS